MKKLKFNLELLNILTDELRTLIRSWYDRGIVGQKSALENTTSLDYETTS